MSIKSKILILAAFILCLPMITSASTIIRPVMNSGLVGYWNFQEGTGTTAYDKSGKRNHGTLTNMDPTTDWVDGKLGGGLDFDGSDDYIHREIFSSVPSNQMTLSAWVKTDNSSASKIITQGRRPETIDGEYLFGLNPNGTLSFWDYDDGYGFPIDTSSLGSVNDGEWHLVSFVKNQTLGKFYIDGEFDSSVSASDDKSYIQDDFAIGVNYRSPDKYFQGKIDEVRIYDRALSEKEIKRLYKLTGPKIKAPTRDGLVGYWSMDEGMGTKVGDMSGNSNYGTMTNMDANTDWVAGRYGKALDFDGSDDYVRNTSISQPTTVYTASCWIYPHKTANGSSDQNTHGFTILSDDPTSSEDRYPLWLRARAGEIRVNTFNDNVDGETTSGANITDNTWHHITVRARKGGNSKVYVNGEEIHSWTNPGDSGDWEDDFYIGELRDGRLIAFDGFIDEVKVFDRILSDSEIKALYESGRRKFAGGTRDDLVGYWPMDDGMGIQVGDHSINSNHGTMQNMDANTDWIKHATGYALDFDGSDDYVEVNDNNTLDITDEISISVWIKATKSLPDDSFDHILTKRSNDSANYAVNCYLGEIYFYYYSNGGWREYYSNFYPDAGEWNHCVIVFKSGESDSAKWYINNLKQSGNWDSAGDGNNPLIANDHSLTIGARSSTDEAGPFVVDEVRIYNRMLTKDEIQQLYEAGH